ncbi:uncharacterized protein LOC141718653 [Apium graveolens]|uniref:uncharacterized protein LOC141718653 n=1 Tax=Apium graveolens TaxID=4045 RepID=UPI003D79AD8F
MGPNYPSSLKRVWMWAKDALVNGRTISFELSEEAFGVTKKHVIFLQDVHAVCATGEMFGSVIIIFIDFLYKYVKKTKMTNLIAFVDPGMIGAIGCDNSGERSHALANHFMNAKEGQCFLIPFNDLNQWSLTVVVPTTEVVYHMDPLKLRIASDEWVERGVLDCGLFVMGYMKEICYDKDLEFAAKWIRESNLAYSEDDVNTIKMDFAKFFMKRYSC